MLWAALVGAALAGTPEVTLNGVDIRALRDTRFQQVDVYLDADGNIHLTSDHYEVQVQQGPDASGAPTPAKAVRPAADPDPVRTAPARVAPTASSTPPGQAVPKGTWWLATEDNASRGHEVRVYINGTLVRTVRSGQAQVIDDVSRHLRTGPNQVMVMSRSLSPGGGGFYVYVGRGSNQDGSVTLEQPDIQFGLSASRKGDQVREYTLVVD